LERAQPYPGGGINILEAIKARTNKRPKEYKMSITINKSKKQFLYKTMTKQAM